MSGFLKKNWLYLVLGIVAIVGVFIYISSSQGSPVPLLNTIPQFPGGGGGGSNPPGYGSPPPNPTGGYGNNPPPKPVTGGYPGQNPPTGGGGLSFSTFMFLPRVR